MVRNFPILYTCRSYILLLHTSTINVLVVPYPCNLLGAEVSFPCKDISDNTSHKVPAHCLRCSVHNTSSDPCACHHGEVFSREVLRRSSRGWPWIWCGSFPTDLVYWKGSRHHVLCSHSTGHSAVDGWNDNPYCCLLDHSQSE